MAFRLFVMAVRFLRVISQLDNFSDVKGDFYKMAKNDHFFFFFGLPKIDLIEKSCFCP